MPKIILRQTTPEPATAIVQDQDGNELARENIASGATQIITVNVQTMINVLKGDFTGEFDLSVQDQQGFYNDYTSGAIIISLSIALEPKLGSFATVRILGGLLAADAIPATWDGYNDLTISQDPTKFNVIMIVYGNNTSSSDIRITNTIIDAPDFIAPEFTSAPTATNITETSFDITAQLNENGTVYGYLLADGSPAPTVQEIIDNAQSQFSDTGTGGTLSFTGLTNETNYDVYVVAVDTAGNRQTNSTLVEVLTAGAISPELQSVINNMPNALTSEEQAVIQNFIDSIDFNNVIELQAYNLLDQSNALTGFINATTAVNNGTLHIPREGFQQQGGTDFINTNIIASTIGLISQNEAYHIYIKNRSVQTTLGFALGAADGTRVLRFGKFANTSGDNTLFNINGAGNQNKQVVENVQNNTVYSLVRSSSTTADIYKNGVLLSSEPLTDLGLTTIAMYIFDQNGATNLYRSALISGIMITDATNISIRSNAFKTLMESLIV